VPRPSAAVKAAADQFAANVLPVIREIGVEWRNQARRDCRRPIQCPQARHRAQRVVVACLGWRDPDRMELAP